MRICFLWQTQEDARIYAASTLCADLTNMALLLGDADDVTELALARDYIGVPDAEGMAGIPFGPRARNRAVSRKVVCCDAKGKVRQQVAEGVSLDEIAGAMREMVAMLLLRKRETCMKKDAEIATLKAILAGQYGEM
jgi:hypothetical protein